jgi:predicted nucleic acid-binding protein
MNVVIDSNILFSALLSSDNRFVLLLHDVKHTFYTCNFLAVELFAHIAKLERLSKLSREDIVQQLACLLAKVHFVNESIIPRGIFEKAYRLCCDCDASDTPFVALALFLDARLLTGDKKLTRSLQKKGCRNSVTIQELIENR